MEELLKVLLVLCSMFEIYLCYRFVFLRWADRGDFTLPGKLLIGFAVPVLGILAAWQRNYFLFSYPVLLIQTLVVCATLLFLRGREKAIGCTVVCLYFSMTALFDYLTAFAMLQVMKESFSVLVYFPLSNYKIFILLFGRILAGSLYFVLRKWAPQIREAIREYWQLLAGIALGAMLLSGIYDAIFMEAMRNVSTMQNAGVIAALIMIIVLILAVGSILLKNMAVSKEQENVRLREEMLETHYRQVMELMEENRERMHDMKHHLHILKEYSEEMDLAKIKKYLSELQEPVTELENVIWTRSQILNLILNQKMQEARKKGIQMKVETEPAFGLELKDTEICSVFGNLLDNALEAAALAKNDQKWVRVKLGRQGEMLFIQISNGILERPVTRNGELITTKSQGGLHGLGMKSVTRIVRRHGGDIQFEAEEERFRVNIVFF